mgnify:CR=1 FL=1
MTQPALTDKTQEQMITQRREKVAHFLIKGYPEAEIAKMVNVSRETVVRDVRVIKMQARGWYANLATVEYLYEYKMMFDKLKDYEYELQQMKNEAKDISDKIKITKALQDNIFLQLKLVNNPTAIHLLEIMKSLEKQYRR